MLNLIKKKVLKPLGFILLFDFVFLSVIYTIYTIINNLSGSNLVLQNVVPVSVVFILITILVWILPEIMDILFRSKK